MRADVGLAMRIPFFAEKRFKQKDRLEAALP